MAELDGTPVMAVWSDSITSFTSRCTTTRTVQQTVTNIKQGLVNKINSNFELDPPLTANEMSHKVFPSTVDLNADILSVNGGIVTLIRPPVSEVTRTGQYLKKMKNGQLSIGTEAQTLTGSALLVDFQKAVMDMQTKYDRLEAKLDEQTTELVKERELRKAEVAKERELRKADVAKERADRKDEQDRLEDKLEKQDRLLEEMGKGHVNLEAELAQAKEELKCQIVDITRLTVKLIPLHLRVLLDLARKRILDLMEINSWEDLRNDRDEQKLTNTIMLALAQASLQHFPSRDAVEFLCSYNNVRRDGNFSAHNASEDEIRHAILTKQVESQDRQFLTQLFEFTFKCPV